ncbi:hypothetical protein DC434_01595 [Microbacterium sp. TPD7012]|nr:hypothetical protein DC434_01595 [Microbacterium sp. TPD7012]
MQVHGLTAVADAAPIAWALELVKQALESRTSAPEDDERGTLHVHLARATDVRELDSVGLPVPPRGEESYCIGVTRGAASAGCDRRAVVAATDHRGYAYALVELSERIRSQGLSALDGWRDVGSPAVSVRGIQRNFSSVHEDLPWFHDRAFWTEYLDHLASQRFNRFHLAFGMQYNYGTGWESRAATDNYLVFAYPFLTAVPGFDVRAAGVDDVERQRNLESLAHIARETTRRGMSFQLGLWNHAYDFGYESKEWYPITGVGPSSHADYCAAALSTLLEAVPEIAGITFRVHHEGGIPEGDREAFWGKIFDAASAVGRPLQIDLHAKGVDDALVRATRRPNLVPMISAKYLSEHMGLAYHQASIRPREQTPLQFAGQDTSVTGVTDGARRFTRYGYADYLDEDRGTDVMFRMWPGTQKLLLWGDPALASGYGRYATIGGAKGLEFCEPLTFKGRRGSGQLGCRDPYLSEHLRLGLADWKKYRYTYVLWGQLMYNPDANAEVWQRSLRADHGSDAAPHLEVALASLSRVLPLVAHVHGVSAANNFYSPELYVDLPISEQIKCMHYAWDTPDPRTWEGVSSFDPTLFYSVGEYADAVMSNSLSARYSPLEVARWLEDLVVEGEAALDNVAASSMVDNPQTQRTVTDLRIVAHLGRFFADKFRAAVQYALHRRTGDPSHLESSITFLDAAHDQYARIPEVAAGVYRDDIAFGIGPSDRGTWADRLPSMLRDLDALKAQLRAMALVAPQKRERLVHRSGRWAADAVFEVPATFERGSEMPVQLRCEDTSIDAAVLHFRHLNQGERWQSMPMRRTGTDYAISVPGDYTGSGYPLAFFAEVYREGDHPVFVPALGSTLANQPYIVIYSSAAERLIR